MSGTLTISKETCDFVETLKLDEGTADEMTYNNVFFFRPPVYCRFTDPELVHLDLRTNKEIILDVTELFGITPFPISINWADGATIIAPSSVLADFGIQIVVNHPLSTTSDTKHLDMMGISISEK